MKRNDWILLGILLTVGTVMLIALYAIFGKTGAEAVITVDGEEIARLPLDQDTELVVSGYNEGTNTVVVQEGIVYVRDASCPDKICVQTGHADELKSIVCLPNRVVITVETPS